MGNESLCDPWGWLATLASCPLAAVVTHFHSFLSGIGSQAPGILLPISSILRSEGRNKMHTGGNFVRFVKALSLAKPVAGYVVHEAINSNLAYFHSYHCRVCVFT